MDHVILALFFIKEFSALQPTFKSQILEFLKKIPEHTKEEEKSPSLLSTVLLLSY